MDDSTWRTIGIVLLVIFVIIPIVTWLLGCLVVLIIGGAAVSAVEPFSYGYKNGELRSYPNLTYVGANLAQRLYTSS